MLFLSATRSAIIAAGIRLFTERSIADVTIDDVASSAGVSRKDFHRFFKTKIEFVAACFESYAEDLLQLYDRSMAGHSGAEARLVAVFETLAERATSTEFVGCAFMRIASLVGRRPDHPLRAVASRFKLDVEARFAAVLAEDGFSRPEALARKVALLVDGAMAQVMYHRDPGYAREAADLLRDLLVLERRRSHGTESMPLKASRSETQDLAS